MAEAMPRRFSEYLAAAGSAVREQHPADDPFLSGVCADTRLLRPGQLFCAVSGSRLDGHAFVAEALRRGAAALLLEHPPSGLPDGTPWACVDAMYPVMGRLAELAAGYPARTMRLLGITGTNGKTTTAYLLRAILQQAGRRPGMIGTVVYDLGGGVCLDADRTTPTPFTLQEYLAAMREHAVTDAVLEVSSHALHQGRLGSARFAGAIFTNLTQDHLDYHLTSENYYQCKKRLFSESLAPAAPAVINLDDPWGRRLAAELPGFELCTFSLESDPGAAINVTVGGDPARSNTLTLRFHDAELTIESPLLGRYNSYNLAGATILAHRLGLAETDIRAALATCPGAPGRLQRFDFPAGFTVFVDYAHTDDALRKALACLRPLCRGRLSVLFGCGGNRDRGKRPLMAQAAEAEADRIIVSSDNPRDEEPQAIIDDILAGFSPACRPLVAADRRQAIALAVSDAGAGDIILIAGKGHEAYQECRGVRHPFSDGDIVATLRDAAR